MHKLILVSLLLALSTQSHSAYQDYDEILSKIAILETKSTHLKSFKLGSSNAGKEIVGVTVGVGPVNHILVSTHHGNEYGSAEVAMAFIEEVSVRPLDGITLHIIPVLNIEGYNDRERLERAKGKYYDPNRDYPGPCGSAGPFNLKSTQALADYIAATNIVASATLHTFYPAVVYPWGFSTRDTATPYDELFKFLGGLATEWSKYTVGNSTEVIYPANGTYEDYAFWKHGIWSLLFELGGSHSPTEREIETMSSENVPGLVKFFAGSPKERATDHNFKGKCDSSLNVLDRHDE
ncbi:MAG: M14 family zinc carboxypeptidase [Pseudomonadota bacterium]|nr:M14 family zinc carboxypeptidase [Pseudomonadota bacterium]